ncbi:hypothetical protein [Actinophytocola glycyrrhizae]|uniref:DUF732 domain-containing protein n=1 Tax=Actinophytocola glycyrrhizae TaxID=2044873 RepID=A0ABV9SC16_9PSEU
MTTSPHPTPPARRRSPWPWALAATVLVAAAVVATTALATGGTDSDDRSTAATSTTTGSARPGTGYDLSTPQAAAESFAAAAETGSGEELLELACVGRPACVREHAVDMSEAQLADARNTIRDGSTNSATTSTAPSSPRPSTAPNRTRRTSRTAPR